MRLYYYMYLHPCLSDCSETFLACQMPSLSTKMYEDKVKKEYE